MLSPYWNEIKSLQKKPSMVSIQKSKRKLANIYIQLPKIKNHVLLTIQSPTNSQPVNSETLEAKKQYFKSKNAKKDSIKNVEKDFIEHLQNKDIEINLFPNKKSTSPKHKLK